MPKKPNKQDSLTIEQLGEAMLETVRQMSPQEKAEVRKQLDQQFKKK
jgi:hypothetical protein